jgi:hypothetical protein
VLTLGGEVQEVMLDIVGRDGTRTPTLINAEQDAAGRTRIAMMAVPDRSLYEQQLREARQLAERAAAESDRVLRRLTVVAQANAVLGSSLDVRAALQELVDVLVGEIADWCVVYAPDKDVESGLQWFAAHVEGGLQVAVRRLAALLPTADPSPGSIGNVLAGRQLQPLGIVGGEVLRAALSDPAEGGLIDELDVGSLLVLPSRARGRQAAVVVLGRSRARTPFAESDLADLTDLAARTGIAIDNLRLYQREHAASMELQRAMLTEPPEHPGVRLTARYRPAAASNEVGGDWYDAFHQPDGSLVLAIGDVMGHDIRAAAAMGQLRGILRTVGHTVGGTPAEMLAAADRAAHGLRVGVLASAVALRLPAADADGAAGTGPRVVQWSNAGHPPPVLIGADGSATPLAARNDMILGVLPDQARHDHAHPLSVGDTLLLYTDGLVERRDAPVDQGIARLVAALRGAHAWDLDQICARALAVAPERGEDDIALLVVRVEG